MHFLTVIGYWNPMGFIPEFCLIKTLCSVSIIRIDGEEAIGNMQIDANSQKAMYFISVVNPWLI